MRHGGIYFTKVSFKQWLRLCWVYKHVRKLDLAKDAQADSRLKLSACISSCAQCSHDTCVGRLARLIYFSRAISIFISGLLFQAFFANGRVAQLDDSQIGDPDEIVRWLEEILEESEKAILALSACSMCVPNASVPHMLYIMFLCYPNSSAEVQSMAWTQSRDACREVRGDP